MSFKKIGLIAGEGRFPIIFAQKAKLNNVDIIAVGIKSKTNKKLKKYVEKAYYVKLGEFKKLINYFKKHNIKVAVMAGKVPKVSIFDKRIIADKELKELLNRVKDKKDVSLLKEIGNVLQLNGIEVLKSTIYMEEFLANKGNITKRKPTQQEQEDIEFGKKIAKEIAHLDIGQTIVVKDKAVLAVEAIEHTDQTIKRASKLGKKDVVVVKVARPNQDMRFDVPAIGVKTIKFLIKAKAKVLALESGRTFIFDKEEIKRLADKHNISIVVF